MGNAREGDEDKEDERKQTIKHLRMLSMRAEWQRVEKAEL